MRNRTTLLIVLLTGAVCRSGIAVESSPNANAGAAPEAERPVLVSIPAYLQLQRTQVEQLNRLFDTYATRRSVQEGKILRWQGELARSGDSTSGRDNRARLQRDIEYARHQVVVDLLDTRAKALKALTPVQRAQLDSLQADRRFQVRQDRYYELLLMPADQLWQSPGSEPAANSGAGSTAHRPAPAGAGGRVGYGVYGGYGYHEPQYGVYGSYGQGSVGVQVGVGRGGPSVGIGVGGILGRRHRW